jgi:hypothetical protein
MARRSQDLVICLAPISARTIGGIGFRMTSLPSSAFPQSRRVYLPVLSKSFVAKSHGVLIGAEFLLVGFAEAWHFSAEARRTEAELSGN